MDRRAAIAALLFAGSAACGGSASHDGRPVVLRVSAAYGISRFALGPIVTGSTARALELIYEPLARHAEVVEQDGARVILRRLPTSPHSAETLAARLSFEGLVGARAQGEEIVCRLAAPELAGPFIRLAGFELGPFGLVRQEPGRAWLAAREPLGIDEIELIEVDAAEEWRMLLGHQLDVIPTAAAVHRVQFDGMASVRTVDLPVQAVMGGYFNTADPVLSDARVRRAIARAIDATAVARVACGDPGCEASWGQIAPETTPLPAHLSLVTLDGEVPSLAVQVIRHQLRTAGVDATVELLPLEQLQRRCAEGRFQLAVLSVARPFEFGAAVFAQTGAFTGYRGAAFDRAVQDRDFEAARRILLADVPVFPLFELRQFAAVDRRFCGGRPRSEASWRWLADLYPCDEGEP